MVSLPSIVEILQEPTFVITVIIAAFGIGTTQGYILGRAVLVKYPRLQNHAKTVSVGLFFLFLINALLSVPRFASPEKIVISKVFEAASPSEIASIVFTVLGVSTGFVAVLAIFVLVVSLIILRGTQIPRAKKVFVLFFSLLILIVTGISRFTDYTPGNFEIFLYFLYQLGITIGIVAGTARKIKEKIT